MLDCFVKLYGNVYSDTVLELVTLVRTHPKRNVLGPGCIESEYHAPQGYITCLLQTAKNSFVTPSHFSLILRYLISPPTCRRLKAVQSQGSTFAQRIQFLESKGLTPPEIDMALRQTSNQTAGPSYTAPYPPQQFLPPPAARWDWRDYFVSHLAFTS